MDTFFKTIKAELIGRDTWEYVVLLRWSFLKTLTAFTIHEAATQHWAGYNPRSRHSTLGWESPITFERIVA